MHEYLRDLCQHNFIDMRYFCGLKKYFSCFLESHALLNCEKGGVGGNELRKITFPVRSWILTTTPFFVFGEIMVFLFYIPDHNTRTRSAALC